MAVRVKTVLCIFNDGSHCGSMLFSGEVIIINVADFNVRLMLNLIEVRMCYLSKKKWDINHKYSIIVLLYICRMIIHITEVVVKYLGKIHLKYMAS